MDTLLAFTCEARACAAVITTADRRFPPTKPPGLCPEQGHPYVRELAKIRDVDYIDLPTGHWPQFTRPQELGRAILASVLH